MNIDKSRVKMPSAKDRTKKYFSTGLKAALTTAGGYFLGQGMGMTAMNLLSKTEKGRRLLTNKPKLNKYMGVVGATAAGLHGLRKMYGDMIRDKALFELSNRDQYE